MAHLGSLTIFHLQTYASTNLTADYKQFYDTKHTLKPADQQSNNHAIYSRAPPLPMDFCIDILKGINKPSDTR